MKHLLHHTKAQKEYIQFQKDIDNIDNEAAKQKGIALLQRLKYRCNIIDNMHSTDGIKGVDGKKILENIDNLVTIRLEIMKLIKDSKDL